MSFHFDTHDLAHKVLESGLLEAWQYFEAAKQAGIVDGDFGSNVWNYRGVNLLFLSVGSRHVRAQDKGSLSPRAEAIGKCFIAPLLNAGVSRSFAVSRLNAFRWLATVINSNDDAWLNLDRSILNRALKEISKNNSTTTVYQRACGLQGFVNFLNSFHSRIDGKEIRFSRSFIRWRHSVRNPIKSSLEITSNKRVSRTEKLYEPNLHIALAEARKKLLDEPSLERRPGYDSIRIESLAFALALGLRVGELCSLPLNALERDASTGRFFVRVAVEKGATPSATAVAELWQDALINSYSFLIDQCSAARARAKEIENNGFSFVGFQLINSRLRTPLTPEREAQLKTINADPNKHFFIDEIHREFSVSKKELTSGGKYSFALVPLPRSAAARMVVWLDERFTRWDWPEHASKHARTGNCWNISVYDVGKKCGVSKSAVQKSTWFVNELKKLLNSMRSEKIFEPQDNLTELTIQDWRQRWSQMRQSMLSHKGGGAGNSCVVVNLDLFESELSRRYKRYLSEHFQEVISEESIESDHGFVARKPRGGVPPKLSNHLIVLWEHQFACTSVDGILPRPIFRSDYYNYLCQNAQKRTVFENFSVLNEDGKPFSFAPHHIRRWVTTALLRSGPSEHAIDMWMGRTPGQTRHYDYRTPKERAENARLRYLNIGLEPNDVLGKKVRFWREEGVEEKQIEFLVMQKLRVLHIVPWGGCSRELYVSPCTKGLMCLRGFGTESACPSFMIDPQDEEAKAAIEKLRNQYLKMWRTIFQNHDNLSEMIGRELNDTEALDQHLIFIRDVVRGCEWALTQYKNNK